MLDHLALQCADSGGAADFYLRVFAPCGIRQVMRFDTPGGAVVGLGGPDAVPSLWFGPVEGPGGRPVHLALTAPSRGAVDEVFALARHEGAEILLEPAEHPEYHRGYYGAFFRDPDGNNVEAVHHGSPS